MGFYSLCGEVFGFLFGMFVKCVIFCLDVNVGCVVKGMNFVNFWDVGDFVEVLEWYEWEGVDELVFFDIMVSYEDCGIIIDVVKWVVEKVFMLLIVGGGICDLDDICVLLKVGCDKVLINLVVCCDLDFVWVVVERFGS